jgi:hypothetical protein
MANAGTSDPTRGFWIIAVLALVWNVLGVATYLMQVTTGPEALADLPEAERLLLTNIPAWVTGAYAVGVFGGTLGALGLLLRKGWAVPVFFVSLMAILVQMGHALFLTNMLEVLGPTSAIMPNVIIVIAAFLLWYAHASKQKGLLSN